MQIADCRVPIERIVDWAMAIAIVDCAQSIVNPQSNRRSSIANP
jgi:hypothetical protein